MPVTPPAAAADSGTPAAAADSGTPAAAADPGTGGAALATLLLGLQREPWAHDFFALMRRIESLQPQAPRIGRAQRPSQELLRLGQVPEMDFAPAPIARFERAAQGAGDGDAAGVGGRAAPTPGITHQGRLGVRFFGLLGPQGPMPLHLTEYVRERQHQHGDPTLARFLDVFHHRMLSLFYRAWAQAQPTVQMDRPADDRYGAWLGASFGLGAGTHASDSIADSAKRFQAGLLGSRSRHPEALVKVLQQYFGVAVALHSHQPQWLALRTEDRSRLGQAGNRLHGLGGGLGGGSGGGFGGGSGGGLGANLAGGGLRGAVAQLGVSANAGHKVFDRQFKFRLDIGPLSLPQYLNFLPGGRAWAELRDWVALLAGAEMRWDARLGLRQAEVPPPQLGSGVRLGLTTWLGRRPAPQRRTPTTTTADHLATGERWDLRLRLSSAATALPPARTTCTTRTTRTTRTNPSATPSDRTRRPGAPDG